MQQSMRKLRFSLLCFLMASPAFAATLGPVTSDTTLWRLAMQARPDERVSMPQVVQALWQHNPQAFREQNVHHLIQGAVFTVPSREQMLALDAAEAQRWYNTQLAQQRLPKPLTAGRPTTTTESAVVANQIQNIVAAPAGSVALLPDNTVVAAQHSTPPIKAPETTNAEPGRQMAAPNTPQGNWRLQHELGWEQRLFGSGGLQQAAKSHALLSYRGQWSYEDASRRHNVNVEPYLRWHQHDSDSHLIDLQQAYWRYIGTGWEIKAGIDTVFWGVTESQHLVDVINQSDLTAGVEMEAKLGQPMLNLRRSGSAGTFDIYVLPYFRERQFPAPAGRLAPPARVNHDLAWYESSDAKHNLDVALRYTQRFAGMDLGLSFFSGNNREPLLQPTPSGELQPLYWQMEQYGLDLQWVQGDWLWKLESIYRRTGFAEYVAATGGFEYSQIGVLEQVWDLGWILEYQYDSRDETATLPGQNDLFLGWRLALNDLAGTEFLFGVLQDLDNQQSRSIKLEGSMRLSDNLRLSINGWLFKSDEPQDTLYWLRRDDYLALQLSYYF